MAAGRDSRRTGGTGWVCRRSPSLGGDGSALHSHPAGIAGPEGLGLDVQGVGLVPERSGRLTGERLLGVEHHNDGVRRVLVRGDPPVGHVEAGAMELVAWPEVPRALGSLGDLAIVTGWDRRVGVGAGVCGGGGQEGAGVSDGARCRRTPVPGDHIVDQEAGGQRRGQRTGNQHPASGRGAAADRRLGHQTLAGAGQCDRIGRGNVVAHPLEQVDLVHDGFSRKSGPRAARRARRARCRRDATVPTGMSRASAISG